MLGVTTYRLQNVVNTQYSDKEDVGFHMAYQSPTDYCGNPNDPFPGKTGYNLDVLRRMRNLRRKLLVRYLRPDVILNCIYSIMSVFVSHIRTASM